MDIHIGPGFYSAIPPPMTMAERSKSQTNFTLKFYVKTF